MICFFLDMDISLPDEILRHCGCIFFSAEESGQSGKDREKSVRLQPYNGGFW